jgi:hypothetical protein
MDVVSRVDHAPVERVAGGRVQALGARACSAAVYDGCYPWGAEGPAAGSWSYASKTNYLIRGLGQLGLVIAAGFWLVWLAGRDRALSWLERALLLLAAAAFVALFFV